MRIGIKLISILAMIICVSGCGMLDYHSYSGKIDGETDLTEKNLERIARFPKIKTEFKFAFISDTQGFYDQTRDGVNAINKRGDVDFLLHGGDLTDFGMTKEFEMMRDELQRLTMPWFTAIGNHDCVATGEAIYQKMFGPENYSFTVGQTRFIVMNSNAMEFDFENVPDLDFFGKEVRDVEELNAQRPGTITQTVVMMHSHPGDDQFNNQAIPEMSALLKRLPKPFCLGGHTHHTETLECFGPEIPFYVVATIKRRQYLLFTIKPDSYEMEVCDF